MLTFRPPLVSSYACSALAETRIINSTAEASCCRPFLGVPAANRDQPFGLVLFCGAVSAGETRVE